MSLTNNKKGKTVQPTTNFGLRKCRRTDAAKDHISKLPDDVLVSILSLLKLKEAARTSVLSNRWRYVWTYTRSLDFVEFFRIWPDEMKSMKETLAVLKPRFTAFVNKVLNSHQGPTIDEFTIGFDLDDKECSNIENWIKFALEREVKRLALDFRSSGQGGHYALTTQFLRNYSLDSIKALFLHSVDVTEEVLYHLLSQCPSLEMFHMAASKSLVNLKVSGPSLRLKHLEIWHCSILKTIEISDIHLVSFKYSGRGNVHFKDVPHLDKLSLNGECCFFLLRNSWQFSTLLSNLEKLVLSLSFRKEQSFPKFPELRNLRRLDLTLGASFVNYLLSGISLLTMLLEVSPLLHSLVLEFPWLRGSNTSRWRRLIELNKVQKANGPHQCLKVFKLTSFVGCEVDIEVAKDILNVAVSLENLIIDASSGNPEENSAARTRARQLETVLPSGAKLVIL